MVQNLGRCTKPVGLKSTIRNDAKLVELACITDLDLHLDVHVGDRRRVVDDSNLDHDIVVDLVWVNSATLWVEGIGGLRTLLELEEEVALALAKDSRVGDREWGVVKRVGTNLSHE